ncbi:phage terminase large subunit family protein [Geothrix sp. 21YS21S-2]|uniref:phage terminase large subunit family protein n=1 Tax=Geothrix sp. 21YS21S-2 TaxID=3068893 RepID=UPI0027BA6805|nr:phage terminase large subunit family protein [Geothrix sp. 21YS21S-2]
MDIRIKDTLRRVLTIIKPKPDINPADWANIFLYVAGGESRFAGRYNTTLMPYQYEMLAVGNDKRYQRITFMLASQTGKSQVITAYILYYTHYKPRPNGIYFPKDTLMKKFADDRLAPSISNSPEIRPLFKKAIEDRQSTQEDKQASKCATHSKTMVEQANTDVEIALEAITARLDMLENHSEGANTKMSDHDVRIAKLEIQISIELRNINEKLDRLMSGR